jgi:hypothetical protein
MSGSVLAEVVRAGADAVRHAPRPGEGGVPPEQMEELATYCESGVEICRQFWDGLVDELVVSGMESGRAAGRCRALQSLAGAYLVFVAVVQETCGTTHPALLERLANAAGELTAVRDQAGRLLAQVSVPPGPPDFQKIARAEEALARGEFKNLLDARPESSAP